MGVIGTSGHQDLPGAPRLSVDPRLESSFETGNGLTIPVSVRLTTGGGTQDGWTIKISDR